MPWYSRVCPDCGQEKIYETKPSRRPKAGTRCQPCSANAARRRKPASYGPTFAQLVPEPEDIDRVVVERLTKGKEVKSNRAEKREAVRILDARGLTTEEITKLVHIDRKTVRKLRET